MRGGSDKVYNEITDKTNREQIRLKKGSNFLKLFSSHQTGIVSDYFVKNIRSSTDTTDYTMVKTNNYSISSN